MDLFEVDIEHSRYTLRRFAAARAVLVLLVALLCVIAQAGGDVSVDLNTACLYAIFFVAMVESLIVVAILGTAFRPTTRFSFVLLTADLVLISAVVALTGGSRSAFAFLYIAAILSTSLLLAFNWSLVIATISSGLFVAMALMEHTGVVSAASVFRLGPPMRADEMWAHLGMKVLAFYLAAFLAGYLSRRIGMLRSIQHNILNSFSSGFISVDNDRKVTFFNTAAAKLLQRPRSQCVGKDISDVFSVAQDGSNPLEDAVAEGKDCQGKEIVVRRGDQQVIPVGVTASPLKGGGGKSVGAVASFVDLTDMKRMEEELRRADRLAAIGEMSDSLAHEIRNPVASIRGAMQELGENLNLTETNERLIRIAIRESDQLNRIVSSFLEFVDTSRMEKGPFDVCKLIEEAVEGIEDQNGRNGGVRIEKECPETVGCIVGERDQIRKALVNLVKNGVEAMPKGGLLRVWAQHSEDMDGRVSISIHDTGVGIPAEHVGKVFDPFYTTKPQGIGLGMTIAHKVIAGNGGTIDLESTEGSGTTVTIALPKGT